MFPKAYVLIKQLPSSKPSMTHYKTIEKKTPKLINMALKPYAM